MENQNKTPEAYLLRTNDLMTIHVFPDNVKCDRFYLTLESEARLWYDTPRLTAIDLEALQHQIKRQCSKLGHTQESLFQTKRIVHYDENVETLDSRITRIRQCAGLWRSTDI